MAKKSIKKRPSFLSLPSITSVQVHKSSHKFITSFKIHFKMMRIVLRLAAHTKPNIAKYPAPIATITWFRFLKNFFIRKLLFCYFIIEAVNLARLLPNLSGLLIDKCDAAFNPEASDVTNIKDSTQEFVKAVLSNFLRCQILVFHN